MLRLSRCLSTAPASSPGFCRREILVGWEYAADAGLIEARVLPAPSAVALAFWQTFKDGSLLQAVAISSARALKGLLIGGALGFLLGLMNGLCRPADLLSIRPCRCSATFRISRSFRS